MVESKELPQRKVTTPSTTRYFTVCKEGQCWCFLTISTLKDDHLEHVELQPEHCIETEDCSKPKVESNSWQGERQVRDVGSQSEKEIRQCNRGWKKTLLKQERNSLGPEDKHEKEWAETKQGECVRHNACSSRLRLPVASWKSGVDKD